MNHNVSVIIPTYRDWNRLIVCLDALQAQSYPQELIEVLIVNNDPSDSVPADLRLPHNAFLINERKPGSYAARNAALKIAKGKIIGFTDSDCIPHKHWIKNAVEFLTKHASYSRVAGPVQIIQKSAKPSIIERYNQLYAFPQEWLISNGGGSVTANLFAYKFVFDSVGGFDETLMSMGDKYWGMKAEAAGFKIGYSENVSVLHPPRSLSELIKKERRHGGVVRNNTHVSPINLYLKFLYELRPRRSGIGFMLGRNKDRSLLDRLTIPFLRHFLILVRANESLKVQLGKKKPSRV